MLDNNASSIRVNPVAALTLFGIEAVLIVSSDTGTVSLATLGLTKEDVLPKVMPKILENLKELTNENNLEKLINNFTNN